MENCFESIFHLVFFMAVLPITLIVSLCLVYYCIKTIKKNKQQKIFDKLEREVPKDPSSRFLQHAVTPTQNV